MVVYAGNTSQQWGTNFENITIATYGINKTSVQLQLYTKILSAYKNYTTRSVHCYEAMNTTRVAPFLSHYFNHRIYPPPSTQHRSNDDCLKDKSEDHQNGSVPFCVLQSCTVICTHTYKQFWQLTVGLGLHFAIKGKGKGFPYSILSVGPGADPGVQAVSLQVTVSHPPGSRLPLLSARPAVTSPAAEHPRPLAGTKLYCLVTEAHRCKQLA